jgi:hypothetical protein
VKQSICALRYIMWASFWLVALGIVVACTPPPAITLHDSRSCWMLDLDGLQASSALAVGIGFVNLLAQSCSTGI